MVKVQKENDSEIFFVEVKEPGEVRRNVLESLKEVLGLLHRFERFKQTRNDKLEMIRKLRSQVKDTNKMMGVIKLKLTQANLKGIVVSEPKPKKIAPKKKEEQKPQEKEHKKEKTEIERLQEELNAIESKLKEFT